MQRDRVKLSRKVCGSSERASVGQTPVHSPQWTQDSSSIRISRLAKDTVICWDCIHSSAASNWSISPDNSTTTLPTWLGATWARIMLAATLNSFANLYVIGIWTMRWGKVSVTLFFTVPSRGSERFPSYCATRFVESVSFHSELGNQTVTLHAIDNIYFYNWSLLSWGAPCGLQDCFRI